jgi:prepilin signal peptidase PulO-like enzyme (type II secretory pathway)
MDVPPPVPAWLAGPALVVLLSLASVADLRQLRVPLPLIATGLVGGPLAAALTGGRPALFLSLLGLTVGGVLLLPFVLLSGKPPGLPPVRAGEAVGSADAVLLATVGAWLGPKSALEAAACASLVGAAWALVAWWRDGRRRAIPIPYVPAIAIGTLLAVLST